VAITFRLGFAPRSVLPAAAAYPYGGEWLKVSPAFRCKVHINTRRLGAGPERYTAFVFRRTRKGRDRARGHAGSAPCTHNVRAGSTMMRVLPISGATNLRSLSSTGAPSCLSKAVRLATAKDMRYRRRWVASPTRCLVCVGLIAPTPGALGASGSSAPLRRLRDQKRAGGDDVSRLAVEKPGGLDVRN